MVFNNTINTEKCFFEHTQELNYPAGLNPLPEPKQHYTWLQYCAVTTALHCKQA